MKRIILDILFVIIGIAIIWLGSLFGLWWTAIVIGLLLGFTIPPTRVAFLLAFFTGGLGWGLPLLYRSFQLPVGKIASLVASILGIGDASGWIVISLTVVFGIGCCIVGTWIGSAVRLLKNFYMHRFITA